MRTEPKQDVLIQNSGLESLCELGNQQHPHSTCGASVAFFISIEDVLLPILYIEKEAFNPDRGLIAVPMCMFSHHRSTLPFRL